MTKAIVRPNKSVLLMAALFTLASSLLPNTAFAGYRCDTDIEKAIEGFDLKDKTINRTSIVEIFEGYSRGSQPSSYEAWVSFKECRGNLVIRMNHSCWLEAAYTKGNCSVNGLKNY